MNVQSTIGANRFEWHLFAKWQSTFCLLIATFLTLTHFSLDLDHISHSWEGKSMHLSITSQLFQEYTKMFQLYVTGDLHAVTKSRITRDIGRHEKRWPQYRPGNLY